MSTAIRTIAATRGKPLQSPSYGRGKKLGKYQRFILEALAESPAFTSDLWKRLQRSGLASALKNGAEDKDFSYSYPPFRLDIAISLERLKRRGLIKDTVLPGSTAYDSSINRHWWYLADTDTTEVTQRLADLNTVANISGQLAQRMSIAKQLRRVIRHHRRLDPIALARLPYQNLVHTAI